MSLEGQDWRSRLKLLALTLAGILAFVAAAILLQEEVGIPFDTTYRIGCAVACLFVIAHVAKGYPGERWPWIGLSLAFVVNVGLFFTPLLGGRASRGELMMFAAPDAVLLLIARLASYRVADEHQRAVRQQLILALVVAVLVTGTLFGLGLVVPRSPL